MKEHEGATLSPKKIITPVCRASYVRLLEPGEDLNGKLKYSVSLIFPPDADLSDLEKLRDNTIKEKWGNKPPANLRDPIREGNDRETMTPEYKDRLFITASSKKPPQVGERIGGKFVQITDNEKIYSGMWVRVSLTCYPYDNKGNKGTGFGLGNVMKIRDDDYLDGRTTGDQDFDGLADSESASYENAPSDTESLFA